MPFQPRLLTNPETGHSFGWKPSPPDKRDLHYAPPAALAAAALPAAVDLRPLCPPIYDQGPIGSCTANALMAQIACEEKRTGKPVINGSRLFNYYFSRVAERSQGFDAGAYPRDCLAVARNLGFPPENAWPYEPARVLDAPGKPVEQIALKHKVLKFAALANQKKRTLQKCLVDGHPFTFGFTVMSSFETPEVARTGLVPMPTGNDYVMGGHDVLCVGYEARGWLVRNSWGQGWGMGGYCIFPYPYLTTVGFCTDMWMIQSTQ